ncbi:hypothetical protein [Caldibacillus debilis]|uniref:Uncharacterized protein n=1 Tax=Caldibacillus debilis TaxID=301148 RepID=A0A150MCK9_9BACI|nr:hypothetical protein [Caldibacillus debilis]KYD22138.1 hypothetical protein B4135_1483 [Caldibacillus debilis]
MRIKKYWKMVLLVTVIVFTVGAYYVQSRFAAAQYPDFVIRKVSGDEREAEPILIHSTYHEGEGENLWIRAGGSEYWREQSYFERLKGANSFSFTKHLQKKYRNFMRGKEENDNSFFEDRDFVGYAAIETNLLRGYEPTDFAFTVACLDKKRKDTVSFRLPVPDREQYRIVYVEKVHVINGVMKVMTTNERPDGSTEDHVYTIDWRRKKMLNDEKIFSFVHDDGGSGYMTAFVVKDDRKRRDRYAVFAKMRVEDVEGEDGQTITNTKNVELAIYDLETGERRTERLPEQAIAGAEPALVSGSTLYFQKLAENGIQIIAYDLEKGKIISDRVFAVPRSERDSSLRDSIIKLTNERIYVAVPDTDAKTGKILIGDLKSGKTLYEGRIAAKEGGDLPKGYRITLLDLNVEGTF